MHEAVVEEISVIRHMIGQENWQPRRIASVRTADGLRMTVGLRDDSGPGATIELFEEHARRSALRKITLDSIWKLFLYPRSLLCRGALS